MIYLIVIPPELCNKGMKLSIKFYELVKVAGIATITGYFLPWMRNKHWMNKWWTVCFQIQHGQYILIDQIEFKCKPPHTHNYSSLRHLLPALPQHACPTASTICRAYAKCTWRIMKNIKRIAFLVTVAGKSTSKLELGISCVLSKALTKRC